MDKIMQETVQAMEAELSVSLAHLVSSPKQEDWHSFGNARK